MDRKFVIALSSLAGSIMLSDAHAIGLGDIKLRTTLNEPLRADIQLVQVKDLSESEILVNLAPKEDFDRAGVDRDFLLTSLRFRLDLDDPSHPKVVVTTQQPIREPFLNFLVEVQWPSGRLLREYTLLMDLPAFAETSKGGSSSVTGARTPAGHARPDVGGVSEIDLEEAPYSPPPKKVKKPAAESVKVRRASQDEVGSNEKVDSAPKASKKSAEATTAADISASTAGSDSYGPTGSNDTLWKIARSVRNGGSIHQNIIAIQRLNPQAFANANINQLKKGQVLKLPSQEEIASIGRADAVAAVEEQNTAWKSHKNSPQPVGAQLDATGRTQTPASAETTPEGQLKLASPAAPAVANAAANAAGQGAAEASSEVAALQNQLTVGMEELNKAQRENQEIASRAKDLDSQTQSAERLLELQNNEMAAMQAKLAAEQQAKADADAKAAADAQAKAVADAQAAADAQAKAAADAQAKAVADAQAAADAQAKAAAAAQTPAEGATVAAPVAVEATQPAPDASSVAPAPTAAVDAGAVTAPPAAESAAAPVTEASTTETAAVETPVAKTPAAIEPNESFIDSLKTTPVISGVVAVLLILLGLFGYRNMASRRAAATEDQSDDLQFEYPSSELQDSEELPDSEFVSAESADMDPEAMYREHDEVEADAHTDLDLDFDLDTDSFEEQPASLAQVETRAAETGDVLGEADIYISFGNFDKGEALLNSAIAGEPDRTDYRLKLLELYKESANLAAFDEAYKGLIELDDDFANVKAGELRAHIAGAEAPVAFGLSSVAAAEGISDDEFDLDMDFDLDLDLKDSSESGQSLDIGAVESPASLQAEEEISLDFDLDDVVVEAAAAQDDDDLMLDLGSDFPSDTAVTAINLKAVSEDSLPTNDFNLDFNLDVDAPADEQPLLEVADETGTASPEYHAGESENAMLDAVTADAGEIDEELDFLSDADESATKLDLARAYIDMGDKEGARDILAEVLDEGRAEQKSEAQALLDSIG